MPRLTTCYAKDMVAGNGVLIWKSGYQAGIYAIAEIIEPPKIIVNPLDIDYWIDTTRIGVKPCAKIRFTSKLLEKPLLWENLKQDLVLKTLMVIR
ncbi:MULTISPECIES: EVE domain-containing protein [Nostoc]|uniref:EVE domain-containing protein n=2 Tax=Nostoc TaxID=1177 RepID=A0ABR8IIP7_9NOSO|nr:MULTISPECIES: EVE domain-containing protein [Nostoc]MBD2563951.1 EVE domain-containing protein [Nostoc linckia FACHB-391]MBD2650832.1 EVE domain-containing protein [Nostoc foliaceum FACHB-393]